MEKMGVGMASAWTGKLLLQSALLLFCWGVLTACASLTPSSLSQPASASTTPEKVLVFSTFDSLFLTAAAGEPRLKTARDSCEKILVARGRETAAYLLAERLTNQTPRQRHYVEKLFGLLSDSGRRVEPGAALRAALLDVPQVPDSVKPQLLYVASTMADSSLADLGLLFITHTSSEFSSDIRRMAARVLGAYPRSAHVEPLLNGLSHAPESERHQRLWALAALAPYPGCDGLKMHLGDSSLAVRQMAVQALHRCADGNFTKLNLTLPEPRANPILPTRPYLAWLELAQAFESPEAKIYAQRLLERLPPATRLYYPAAKPEVR